MEEKILAKLDRIEAKVEKVEVKFEQMEDKFEQMEAKMEIKFDELKKELKTELKIELKSELSKELKKELKKEILDHMFVFEAEYGRKINILFEEIMCQNAKDRNIEEDLVTLERRVDKNSAFVMSHENQLATLNRAKL